MVADSINIIIPIIGEWKVRLTFVTMFYNVNDNTASLSSCLIDFTCDKNSVITSGDTLSPSTPVSSTRLSILAVLHKYYVYFFGKAEFLSKL